MPPAVRLCLALEHTAKAGACWHRQNTFRNVIEPLLSLLESVPGGCELSLVLFGAHPPHSAAAVESSLGWCSSVSQFRQQLLDSLDFMGGGNRPVALAEALLEAAALFACASVGGASTQSAAAPGAAPACQQHCLVCLASDPDTQPVPWPSPEDCSVAKLPGLATSAELCHAFRRRGIQLGVLGPNLLSSSQQLWHLVSLVSEVPLSLADVRSERLKRQGGEVVQQQLMRTTLALPAGGPYVALPFWQQALEMLQHKVGAKLLSTGSAGASRSAGGLQLVSAGSEAVPEPEDPAAKRARGGGAPSAAVAPAPIASPAAAAAATAAPQAAPPAAGGAAAAAGPAVPMQAPAAAAVAAPQAPAAAAAPGAQLAPLAGVIPSPEAPPVVQWTPPGTATMQQATPPGVAPSPGSFWEVLNAEILSPGDVEALAVPQPGMQPQPQAQAQLAGAGYAPQEPAVPGLPLPPIQQPQARPQQAQQGPAPGMLRHPHPQQLPQPPQQLGAAPGAGPPGMMGMPPGAGAMPNGAVLQPAPAAAAGGVPAAAGPSAAVQHTNLIHTAKVFVDPKVAGRSLLLGMGQVYATQQDTGALLGMSWPAELHVVRSVDRGQASKILATKPNCRQARLKLTLASPEAQSLYDHLLKTGMVGVVSLANNIMGVLLPVRQSMAGPVVPALVVVGLSSQG